MYNFHKCVVLETIDIYLNFNGRKHSKNMRRSYFRHMLGMRSVSELDVI